MLCWHDNVHDNIIVQIKKTVRIYNENHGNVIIVCWILLALYMVPWKLPWGNWPLCSVWENWSDLYQSYLVLFTVYNLQIYFVFLVSSHARHPRTWGGIFLLYILTLSLWYEMLMKWECKYQLKILDLNACKMQN